MNLLQGRIRGWFRTSHGLYKASAQNYCSKEKKRRGFGTGRFSEINEKKKERITRKGTVIAPPDLMSRPAEKRSAYVRFTTHGKSPRNATEGAGQHVWIRQI